MRTLLLLAVGLPMLMPPGVCVCQFVPYEPGGAAEPARTVDVSAALQDSADAQRCGCCRRDRSSGGDFTHGAAPAKNPGPVPGKHWPGCPAAIGAAPVKVAVPAPTPFQPDAPACLFVAHTAEPRLPSVSADFTSTAPAAPPLYLSHCTLLI